MLQNVSRTHLLIGVAVASALAILYLYRELHRARVALSSEKCTGALCAEGAGEEGGRGPAKRVRFEEDGPAAAGDLGAAGAPRSGAGSGWSPSDAAPAGDASDDGAREGFETRPKAGGTGGSSARPGGSSVARPAPHPTAPAARPGLKRRTNAAPEGAAAGA